MSINLELIKELRERTNAGMMECKKALMETAGNVEEAIEVLRKAGQAKAAVKSQRIAAEGVVVVLLDNDAQKGVVLEVNSQTDFVARGNEFQAFAKETAKLALDSEISSVEVLRASTEPTRLELMTALGENIHVRRVSLVEVGSGSLLGAYSHGDANGVRIGVIVALKGGTAALARDLAMQVAAMRPEYLSQDDIPKERLEKEKEIYQEQLKDEKKPGPVIEKIIEGKLKKFAADVTLLGQSYVKDPNKTIEALLKESKAEVLSFVRYEVGEGIEKQEGDFAAEVMAQIKS